MAGSQLTLNGVTAAMVFTFMSVSPENAGKISAMYNLGMFTSMPLGALAASLLPLTREGDDHNVAIADTFVFNIHLFFGMVGWVMVLNLPRHLFLNRSYIGLLPAPASSISFWKIFTSTTRSICSVRFPCSLHSICSMRSTLLDAQRHQRVLTQSRHPTS